MKAASLLGVFLLAKVCVLAGRDMPLSVWTPLAYFWQDFLVVAVFALVEQVVHSRTVVWGLYALVAVYVAINVPVARVLATPLTVPLLRAARGPLMDSIAYYVTWANVGLLALVLTAAAAFPFLLPRCMPQLANQPRQPRWRIAILASTAIPILILVGPVARNRTDTVGLERNCLVALITSAFPHDRQDSATFDATTDWRASPFPGEAGEDLTKYRGAASGRNVVVVHLESTAARYLRSYDANEDPMPNLTRLAKGAILFENAYAV